MRLWGWRGIRGACVSEVYETGKWFSVQIVVGYRYVGDEISDQVVAEEKSHLVFVHSDEELWNKADELLKFETPEYDGPNGYEIGIYDRKRDVVFRAKHVGAHLRRLSIVAGSDYLGKPNSEHAGFPEAVFQCMVFESYDDFLLFACGHKGSQSVRVKMFSDPDHYMFCLVDK